ncbi:hypothetical protein Tco_1442523, partial [Tanacetum coccineum]
IPLSQFIVDILEYFQINLSQLSVIAAAKVSYFEILCCVNGFVPTVGNFRRFYINSKNKGWISFSKRAENAPVCYTRPLDSLKNWNDHFFWVDASAFPFVVPWHNNKTLRKDPHPMPAEFNADVCNYLADNPAPFIKFSEPFLCFVGISQYYDLDENCYPTFWANDDEGGCLMTSNNVNLDNLKNNVLIPLDSWTSGLLVYKLPLSVNAQNKPNLSITGNDINIKLSKEFLVGLHKNAYHGWIDEDVIDHIVNVLEMIDLIYIPGVDSHQLRMKVFPLSLADDTQQ